VRVEVWDSSGRIRRLSCDLKSNCVIGAMGRYLDIGNKEGL
jgi:hypothetical protein